MDSVSSWAWKSHIPVLFSQDWVKAPLYELRCSPNATHWMGLGFLHLKAPPRPQLGLRDQAELILLLMKPSFKKSTEGCPHRQITHTQGSKGD